MPLRVLEAHVQSDANVEFVVCAVVQAALLGFEAQGVMALRMMRLAAGGARGRSEAERMVTEKIAALTEAQAAAASAAITGGTTIAPPRKSWASTESVCAATGGG